MKRVKEIKYPHDREWCAGRMCNGRGFIPSFPCVCSCHAEMYNQNKQKEINEIRNED